MITRFAPTPSGYLHLGNAANALLTSWLATAHRGVLALRVDDMDAARTREDYVADIFGLLEWLGIAWAAGPRTPGDVAADHARRIAHFRRALSDARDRGLPAYACRCSRRILDGPAAGGCPGGCRHAGHRLEADVTALRVLVPEGTRVAVGGTHVDVAQTMGDLVIWRRDDLPASHLASLVEDRDLGTTHVVRGSDLLTSTAAQLYLAPFFDAQGFRAATFVHHGLLHGPDGAKLSKSQLASGEPLPRSPEMRERVTAAALALGAPSGITPPN